LQAEYGGRLIPLFIVTERNRLMIFTKDNQPTVEPGQTLIGMELPEGALEEEEVAGRVPAL
jgi:hypothetical protein